MPGTDDAWLWYFMVFLYINIRKRHVCVNLPFYSFFFSNLCFSQRASPEFAVLVGIMLFTFLLTGSDKLFVRYVREARRAGTLVSYSAKRRASHVVGLNKVGVSKFNKLRAHCWAVSLSTTDSTLML